MARERGPTTASGHRGCGPQVFGENPGLAIRPRARLSVLRTLDVGGVRDRRFQGRPGSGSRSGCATRGATRRVAQVHVGRFGRPLGVRVGRGKRAGRATERSGRVDRRLWEGYQ